jgi:hypothetical protein
LKDSNAPLQRWPSGDLHPGQHLLQSYLCWNGTALPQHILVYSECSICNSVSGDCHSPKPVHAACPATTAHNVAQAQLSCKDTADKPGYSSRSSSNTRTGREMWRLSSNHCTSTLLALCMIITLHDLYAQREFSEFGAEQEVPCICRTSCCKGCRRSSHATTLTCATA